MATVAEESVSEDLTKADAVVDLRSEEVRWKLDMAS